jgi:hypothetical protein
MEVGLMIRKIVRLKFKKNIFNVILNTRVTQHYQNSIFLTHALHLNVCNIILAL